MTITVKTTDIHLKWDHLTLSKDFNRPEGLDNTHFGVGDAMFLVLLSLVEEKYKENKNFEFNFPSSQTFYCLHLKNEPSVLKIDWLI